MAVSFSLTSLSSTPPKPSSPPTTATLASFYSISSKTLPRFTFNPLSKPSTLTLLSKPPLTHLRSPPRNTIRSLFTGEIVAMVPEEDSLWIKVKTRKEILKYVVPKGYIAVDGTSLTVVDVFCCNRYKKEHRFTWFTNDVLATSTGRRRTVLLT
ncbi:hypothetical protein ACLB2K_046925 [Fragaria x ananassa]